MVLNLAGGTGTYWLGGDLVSWIKILSLWPPVEVRIFKEVKK
jgi:hypothetical protein